MPTRFPFRAFAALLLFLVAGAVAAQPSRLSGFGLLRLEPSARAAALAGSYGAVIGTAGGDVNGLFYNPALLDAEAHRQLAVSYLNHLSDVNAGFAAFGYDVPRLGGTL
ncbi:MAG: hypothetical protein R3362_13375, partial [Rhodothermales bacterium]|nr:hypothetical protein [Rhodothermales bacterium]